MKKLKALLEVVLLMGVAYLVYEIMFFVYNYIVYKGVIQGWSWINIKPYSDLNTFEEVALRFVEDHPLEYTVLCWLIISILFIVVAMVSRLSIKEFFGLGWLSVGNGLASICVGLGLVFLINGGVRLVSQMTELKFFYLSEEIFGVYDVLYLWAVVGIITPIYEELFFRGVLCSRLAKGFGQLMTIVISSILFSLSHLNVIQGIYVFPIGLFAAYLVYLTGSIFAGMWLHIIYNMVNIYLAKIDFFQYNSVQLLMMMFIGMVLLVFGMDQVVEKPIKSTN